MLLLLVLFLLQRFILIWVWDDANVLFYACVYDTVVDDCAQGGNAGGSYVSFLPVFFSFFLFLLSFSPSVFHGWACVCFLDFFGGYRLKCRVNYSFFHHWASNSYILLSTLVLGLGFLIGASFFDIFALRFFWAEKR